MSDGFELWGESGPLRDLLVDTWRSRDLITTLARKDFLVRYRRASFGVLWALALPLFQAAVLALVVPKFAHFTTPGSYITFVFAGTVAWAFFLATVTQGSTSIVDNQGVTTRVYFPRVVLPLAAVLSNLYSFVPTLAILVVMTVVTGGFGPQLLIIVPASLRPSLIALGARFRGETRTGDRWALSPATLGHLAAQGLARRLACGQGAE